MSRLTRALTAPWRALRRLRSLVQDEDHDTWLDEHRQPGHRTDTGAYGTAEKVARNIYLGGTGGGGGAG